MSKHTPGPWMVVSNESGLQVFNDPKIGHAEPLAALSYQPSYRQSPTAQANARLIAAAPELLAAAEAITQATEEERADAWGSLMFNLETAIRRARGEE